MGILLIHYCIQRATKDQVSQIKSQAQKGIEEEKKKQTQVEQIKLQAQKGIEEEKKKKASIEQKQQIVEGGDPNIRNLIDKQKSQSVTFQRDYEGEKRLKEPTILQKKAESRQERREFDKTLKQGPKYQIVQEGNTWLIYSVIPNQDPKIFARFQNRAEAVKNYDQLTSKDGASAYVFGDSPPK
jgi:hypothetical protein